jgi:serine protease AprX
VTALVHTSVARRTRIALAFAAGVSVLAAASTPTHAQHRARVSADLADHLAAGSQSIDVIVHGDSATIDQIATRYNLVVKRHMKSGGVFTVTAGQLDALSQDETIDHLSGDTKIRPSDVTTETIGSDQLQDGGGNGVRADDNGVPNLTGDGIGVGVIDSGIDVRHRAFRKHPVRVTVDFTGGDGMDRYGHGTHVAATIAGAAGTGPDASAYHGVAPDAFLLNLRVLDDTGSGTVSNAVEAIDWAIDHREAYNIRVLNLSLGTPVLQPYRDDPLCEAVERAVKAGIVVVAAAGNFGRLPDGTQVLGGTTAPGNSPHALTVGALDTHQTPQRSDDTVATFSSRGPTRYDLIIKPDLVAPGAYVVSAEAPGSLLSTTLSDRHVAGTGENSYIQLSGTSMSTAVASGAVALLLQERPDLGPSSVKVVLQLTSTFLPSAGLIGGGAGSLNALAAAEYAANGLQGALPTTTIGGETVQSSGIAAMPSAALGADSVVWGAGSVVWGADSVVWGAKSVVWGAGSVVWGAGSVVWGADSVVWGADSVVWGAGSVVWGADSVVWGADSVVWGAALNWQ